MSTEASTAVASDRPGTAKVWLAATRPATLLACVVPIVVGTAVAFDDGKMNLAAALVALVSSGFIQIGTNLFNDYADFKKGADTEERLGPARATQKGWLSPGQVLAGAVVCFALSIAFGMILVWMAGWPILVIGLVSVLMGVAYTGGPFPLAYHGLGDIFVWLFFGVVAVCGTYYIQAGTVSLSAFLVSNAVGLLATNILVVNNLRDRHTDTKAGKRTLAVRFGARAARIQYAALLVLSYLVPVVAVLMGLGDGWWFLCWLSMPLAVKELRAIWRTDGAALNPHLGGAARLEMIFGLLLAVGIAL